MQSWGLAGVQSEGSQEFWSPRRPQPTVLALSPNHSSTRTVSSRLQDLRRACRLQQCQMPANTRSRETAHSRECELLGGGLRSSCQNATLEAAAAGLRDFPDFESAMMLGGSGSEAGRLSGGSPAARSSETALGFLSLRNCGLIMLGGSEA